MEPRKLLALLRGELDWVVMKCLEKSRERRYETANGLARDIQRYLADEAVEARPPSTAYRLGKFLKRHKGPMVAVGVVLAALVVGIVGTTLGLVRAWQAEGVARQRYEEAESERARAAASAVTEAEQRQKAEKAEADTLADYRASTDDAIEQLIGSKEELGPKEKAYLENTLKRWQAFAARQGDDQRSRAIRAEGHSRVAILWGKLERLEEAQVECQMACDLYKNLVDQLPTVPEYQNDLAGTHHNLGLLLAGLGKREEARAEYQAARDLQKKLVEQFPAVPEYQKDLADTHTNLGILLVGLEEVEEARAEFQAALDLRKKLVEQFPAVPSYQIDLGGSYCNSGNRILMAGQAAESLPWFDLAVRTLKPVHDKEPRHVYAKQFLRNSHWKRALAYDRLKKPAEAVKDWDRAIELSAPTERPGFRANRASSQVQAGQVDEAVAEVAELTKNPFWAAVKWYNFACIYAVASGKIADKKQDYADRAMELLQKAVKAGYKDLANMAKDPDLDALRERDDFKKLLAELEKKP